VGHVGVHVMLSKARDKDRFKYGRLALTAWEINMINRNILH